MPVAGVNRRKPIVDVEPEDYDFIVDTNLKGLYFGVQAAVRAMLPREGRPNGKVITIKGFSLNATTGCKCSS